MIASDPNVAKVELITKALGPLRERLVLVGGCAAGLLFTDPAAAPARVTYDVDLLAEVTSAANRTEAIRFRWRNPKHFGLRNPTSTPGAAVFRKAKNIADAFRILTKAKLLAFSGQEMKNATRSGIFESWRARQDSVTSRDPSAAVFRNAKNIADAFRILTRAKPLARSGRQNENATQRWRFV